ncbi:flagellar biosynthetic protein FlhB [Clostridia bacterium]|nr:flagellar biosynthetic protein FlhB [Clostridia bacterium]
MAGEKTEKATQKKREDSRKKEGNVLQSKEISTAVSILGIFFLMGQLAPFMYVMLTDVLKEWFGKLSAPTEFTLEFMTQTSLSIAKYFIITVGPILVISMVAGTLPTIIQTKGLWTMEPVRPKFSRLNPLTGLKKVLFPNAQSLMGIVKGIIVVGAIGVIVYQRIMGMMPEIMQLTQVDLIEGILFTAQKTFDVIMTISIIFAFVAVGDYLFQWWQYEKKLKMSKQEVKDEYKNTEGDPLIKSKIRQKQRELASRKMLEDVPSADVVVRNPTHYAVALKYDSKGHSAPLCVAKGKDLFALRIVEVAESHGVFVKEDRPTARALYEAVDIGKMIPAELYAAAAIIFADMYQEKGLDNPGGNAGNAGNSGGRNPPRRSPIIP